MASGSSGPGEINYPVACGGVVVNPGDIVVGDAEGIVVIPREDAADVHAAWLKIVERERDWQTKSAAGQTYGKDDVDELLAGIGCEIRD
jgi:regulator of RNase E activity RraA